MKYVLTFLLIAITFSACQNPFGGEKETFNADFSVKDTSAIDHIVITDTQNNTLDLSRESGQWIANGKHEIRQDFIKVVLNTFYQMQKKYPVPKNMRGEVMKRMNTMARKIEVYQGDQKVREIYMSSAPSNEIGSYMYLKGDDIPYVVAVPGVDGILESRFNTDIADWKSHEIFKYKLGDIKSVHVEYPLDGLKSFTVHQPNNDEFVIEHRGEQREIKKLKALAFYNSFSNINAEAFENGHSKRDSIVRSKPHAIIEVTNKRDEKRKIVIFRMPNNRRSKMMYDEKGKRLPYDLDRYFATIRDGKEFVIIQQYVFEKLFRKYEDFI